METNERLAHSLAHHSPHSLLVMKLNLTFRRMDIYVHGGRTDLDEKAADWIASFHQGCVIRFNQGVIESTVLDWPPIDKKMLLIARGSRYTRRPDQTPDARRLWIVACFGRGLE